MVGCAIATYLTLYQWHVTASVWDPIFGSRQSERVLTSFLTRILHVPDATLGALAYLAEAAVTLIGGEQRWRSAPWAVVIYGLALTSVALVLTQVLLVHALCVLCLRSAAISLVNAWLGRGEVFATLRELGYAL